MEGLYGRRFPAVHGKPDKAISLLTGTPGYEQRYIHISTTMRMAWAELLLLFNHRLDTCWQAYAKK